MAVADTDPLRQRIVAVDVLRGLVLVVLLPDLAGGFSFYTMAEKYPDDWVWRVLAEQFKHVPWSGAAVWDLVMPLFVFLVGVSMSLSYHRRQAVGQGQSQMLGHALLRSVTLVVLGLLLQLNVERRIDELLPYLVLSGGLPIASWWHSATGRTGGPAKVSIGIAYCVFVLACAIGWLGLHVSQLGDYQFGNQILVLMGLAYLPVFLMLRWSAPVQTAAIAILLSGYGALFILYTPAGTITPSGEIFTGIFSHWNNGDNVAAAFDRWFLNLLPRKDPYVGNPHGYHTLQFVPLAAGMLVGAMVGRLLAEGGDVRRLALRLGAMALAGLGLAWLLTQTLFPLVKSLWTPSWAVFSTSICALLLALLLHFFGPPQRSSLGGPLIILGTNSMLLYVIAFTEHWRLATLWQRIFGSEWVASLSWWPVAQSCLVLLTLWALAYVLFRLRVFVRV